MKYLKQPALNSLDEFSWVNPKADLLSEIIWILSYKIAHKIRERIIMCHDMREKKQIDTRGEDEMKKKKKNEEEEGEENKTKQDKRINTQTSVRS